MRLIYRAHACVFEYPNPPMALDGEEHGAKLRVDKPVRHLKRS